MTEKRAEQEGLHFTGIYSRSSEKVKIRIAEERKKKKGCRIVFCTVPDNPLSRGGVGIGYSAYADSIYADYDMIEHSEGEIKAFPEIMTNIHEKHKKEIAEAQDRHDNLVKCVMQAKANIEQALKK